MPSQPPLPPLLNPYLSSQPESSLTLISSILGATSNWLVLRFLHAALSTSLGSNASIGIDQPHNGSNKKVVLVSFLRGWEFWKAEAKRLVSLPYRPCTASPFPFGSCDIHSIPFQGRHIRHWYIFASHSHLE